MFVIEATATCIHDPRLNICLSTYTEQPQDTFQTILVCNNEGVTEPLDVPVHDV